MTLDPLTAAPDDALLAEITGVYASNPDFHRISGDFPDPHDVRPEQVAASLNAELVQPTAEFLLAREDGVLVGVAATLGEHPDPIDPYPWLGLLLVHGDRRRQGHGRRIVALVEERFRAAGRDGLRLAVLDGNTAAIAFWRAQGYRVIDHRPDRQQFRPCSVLHKEL
jgi:GNAT superfamily N-acetyltransferase